jgi:SAM-dependent methyltransferase
MKLSTLPADMPEISDAIVSFDPETLARRAVVKETVVREFLSFGNKRAARIVLAIPEHDGVLDADAVDRILITSHCEMQRISEEFQHGQRVLELLQPLIITLRERSAFERPLRIVDIGCGTGYVIRWLAANAPFGKDVELIGADYNVALIEEARRLANVERLNCSFRVANAFQLAEPASIYLSTGILHHFRGDGLRQFFRQHEEPATSAYLHFDFQPTRVAPFGSWLFHAVRMRQSLAKHDGVLSAVRAHSAQTLLQAAQDGAPGFLSAIYGARFWHLPLPRVFHTLVGIRKRYRDSFIQVLGSRARRLGAFQNDSHPALSSGDH